MTRSEALIIGAAALLAIVAMAVALYAPLWIF
jgi:hypothetical protein